MPVELPWKSMGPLLRLDYADCIFRGLAVDELMQALTEDLSRREKPRVVINFQDVESLTSATLGMLLTVEKAARRAGGQMRLCGIGPKISGLFHVTRINQIIPIDPGLSDSQAALLQPAAESA